MLIFIIQQLLLLIGTLKKTIEKYSSSNSKDKRKQKCENSDNSSSSEDKKQNLDSPTDLIDETSSNEFNYSYTYRPTELNVIKYWNIQI